MTETGPWLYLALAAIAAGPIADALTGERGFNLFGFFVAFLFLLQMRHIALVATDRALYVVEAKKISTQPPRAIQPSACAEAKVHALWITIGGQAYLPIPAHLRRAHQELATELAPLETTATEHPRH